MKLSAYPFPEGLRRLERFGDTRTPDLLDTGFLVKMTSAGLPLYTPIGEQLISRIERCLQVRFESAGFRSIRLPSMVRTSDLEGGESVGDKFASKFMRLSEPLDAFHLLTTPETLIMRTMGPAFSHSQLPIRLSYTADFFRNVSSLKSFIVCRQFRIFGALVVDGNDADALTSLGEMKSLIRLAIAELGIPIRVQEREDRGFEVFFPTADGDYRSDHLEDSGEAHGQRLLSLGMGYPYGRNAGLPYRVRTAGNRNAAIHLSTLGFCTNRLLFAAFDAARAAESFRLPTLLRPFDVAIIPRTCEDEAPAKELMERLNGSGLNLAFDDRYKISRIDRERFATALGMPVQVVAETGGQLVLQGGEGGHFQFDTLDGIVPEILRQAGALR